MARFVKGNVVVVPFPFSDLSQAKRRPALTAGLAKTIVFGCVQNALHRCKGLLWE
jgi:hypothetical protein